MKNYAIFDTSVGSMNVGDQIINNSFNINMKDVYGNGFVVRYGTHIPTSHFYQNNKYNRFYRYIKSCTAKFIVGTNILSNNMLEPWPNWNVNIFNCSPYRDSILVGCGYAAGSDRVNLYTKLLYSKILSKDMIHSVRDERTKRILNKLGYKAINTGCVTMWGLTKDHCNKIPAKKHKNVIFTLTDYKKDTQYDQCLIDILNENYEKVYYWIQGSGDLEYIKTLKHTENIIMVNPNLEDYKKTLIENDIDYVGTRLHAGVYAMQNFVRSIILIVDNRARDMKETYNLPAIERNEIKEKLKDMIKSEYETRINIDEEKIREWKEQFYEK